MKSKADSEATQVQSRHSYTINQETTGPMCIIVSFIVSSFTRSVLEAFAKTWILHFFVHLLQSVTVANERQYIKRCDVESKTWFLPFRTANKCEAAVSKCYPSSQFFWHLASRPLLQTIQSRSSFPSLTHHHL